MVDIKGKGKAVVGVVEETADAGSEYREARRSAMGASSSHASSSGSTTGATRARRTGAPSPAASAASPPTPTPPPLVPASRSERFMLKNMARRGVGRQPRKGNKRQAGGIAGAGVGNVAEGYPACNDVGNNVLSCFPESGTRVVQDEWSKFIWNLNYPTFIGAGYVDIHLFSADSEQQVTSWTGISNARGSIGIDPNDEWLPIQDTYTPGINITHSYYFIVATRGSQISGGEPHQATFEMIQTAAPSSLSASLAAASSASAASSFSSASLASESASLQSVVSSLPAAGIIVNPSDPAALSSLASASSSLSSVLATNTQIHPSGTGGPRNIRGGESDNSNVPKWAIALVTVFGLLALLAGLVALWMILRALRRRRQEQYAEAAGGESHGSSPMMQQRSNDTRPTSAGAFSAGATSDGTGTGRGGGGGGVAGLLTGLGIGAGAGAAGRRTSKHGSHEDVEGSPNDSANSYPQHARDSSELGTSAHNLAGKSSQRSLNSALNAGDAAFLSEAFRNVLRKPEFVHHEESGSSAGTNTNNNNAGLASPSSLGVGTTTPKGFGEEDLNSKRKSMAGQQGSNYGDRESDSEDAEKEGNELIKSELASEGTSVRSVVDRRKPDIRHD